MIGKLTNGKVVSLAPYFYDSDGNEYEWHALEAFGTFLPEVEKWRNEKINQQIAFTKFAEHSGTNTRIHGVLEDMQIKTFAELFKMNLDTFKRHAGAGYISTMCLKKWIDENIKNYL